MNRFTNSKPSFDAEVSNPTDEKRLNRNQGLIISDKRKSGFIKVDRISLITASGDYSDVTLQNGEKMQIQKSLKEWEDILPEKTFYRHT